MRALFSGMAARIRSEQTDLIQQWNMRNSGQTGHIRRKTVRLFPFFRTIYEQELYSFR